MLRELAARITQGHRTISYPKGEVSLSDRYLGLPKIHGGRCESDCSLCVKSCPAGAISRDEQGIKLDLGLCLFCGQCEQICPSKAIEFTPEHRMSCWSRQDLVVSSSPRPQAPPPDDGRIYLFRSSFKIRQVSAGGCNACEADINVLSTIGFDLGRFGISVVASPRHADGLLVTGPVPNNMQLALEKTYNAMPEPRFVVAVGVCAISGGAFSGCSEGCKGVNDIIPVDMWIPGCPPHPLTILNGLLRLTGKLT